MDNGISYLDFFYICSLYDIKSKLTKYKDDHGIIKGQDNFLLITAEVIKILNNFLFQEVWSPMSDEERKFETKLKVNHHILR